MLSEEEKEAIEELKKEYRLSVNSDSITTAIRNEYANIILNLITKLQTDNKKLNKENQEEIDCSENCKDDDCYLIKAVDGIIDLYKNLKAIEQEHQKINRELREEIDIQIEHNKEIDNMNKILANTIRGDSIIINDSISKDKIREKIEELKSSREFYQNFPDDYMAEISINVLKEFLEE